MELDRRGFLGVAAGVGMAAGFVGTTHAAPVLLEVPDGGWKLWLDREARYLDDRIFLPSEVDLAALPVNPPTGGWPVLAAAKALNVILPTTVEEHCWGAFGERPYTADEYRYAEDDPVPQNGAYRGVSWWYRDIDIPAAARGKRVMLHLRGARMRAEIYLNETLVGYSIMSELPIDCDLTAAMQPGRPNRLAIRITNPGGRYDWRDSTTIDWGGAKLFLSHGFGGLDRGMTLSAHPIDARITDAWVLNTPDPRTVTARMEIAFDKPPRDIAALKARATLALLDPDGVSVPAAAKLDMLTLKGKVATATFTLRAAEAKLWDLGNPNLYVARFGWGEDTRSVRFGFRWFAPDGIGSNAVLRLNGRRVRLYSAISWGYWGYNGLWPTPELARREVTSAKALGLNCLHFHRNVGKAEVLAAQDEMGLLRVMEPGGGRFAIGRDPKPGERSSPADRFSRDFLVEKCVAMAKAFRSHPSLVQYTLQNELSANLANPDVQAVLKAIHDTDPSRTVVLNDGFVQRGAAQAMYLPYDDHFFRSDKEQWGDWWNNHQGAGDQWYDKFYQGKDDYIHRQTGKPFIVEFGEMEGCAVADNHARMVADIEKRGRSYDLADHRAILTATDAFLDTWGFRKAFPTAESLFLSIGRKAYESWQNYLENIRIGDEVDIACISGWESTAIENHSGIVDNLRYFKADPELVRASLLPVRPIAKQRRLVYAIGESASLDLYLFNDSGEQAPGTLRLSVTGPDGREREVGTYPVPVFEPDVMRHLIAEQVALSAFALPGAHHVRFAHSAQPDATFERTMWVVAPAAKPARPIRIGVAGIGQSLRTQLSALGGISIEDWKPGGRYDGIVAQGLKADEIARRQVGEQTGLEAQPKKGEKPKLVLGEIDAAVLDAVKNGTPLLALVPEDGLADGVARQLSALGLFGYHGQVGDLRAPWMGNWNYLSAHPLFDGIPADMATSVLHQVEGQASNGLLVDGEGVEIIAGYSRDHDRRNGAASLIARRGGMRVAVHRMPDMVAPLQRRFLENAVRWLAAGDRA
ncbi:MAG: sugar-binding domain-containing protein [Sphingomonas sp.]|uniref:sugar-binding domain-containing protein n=1 Tax=Sphingomonas sp. TaxID=28214 RepID=UPI003F81EB17